MPTDSLFLFTLTKPRETLLMHEFPQQQPSPSGLVPVKTPDQSVKHGLPPMAQIHHAGHQDISGVSHNFGAMNHRVAGWRSVIFRHRKNGKNLRARKPRESTVIRHPEVQKIRTVHSSEGGRIPGIRRGDKSLDNLFKLRIQRAHGMTIKPSPLAERSENGELRNRWGE